MPADRPTCETCVWWDGWFQGSTRGKCRKNPPTKCENCEDADWPVSANDDWCGAHSPVAVPRTCRMHPNLQASGADLFLGFSLCNACWTDQAEAYSLGSDPIREFIERIRKGPEDPIHA